MIWKNKYHPDWRRRFALFPSEIPGGLTVWFGFYEERYVEQIPNKDNGFCFAYWDRRLPQ